MEGGRSQVRQPARGLWHSVDSVVPTYDGYDESGLLGWNGHPGLNKLNRVHVRNIVPVKQNSFFKGNNVIENVRESIQIPKELLSLKIVYLKQCRYSGKQLLKITLSQENNRLVRIYHRKGNSQKPTE